MGHMTQLDLLMMLATMVGFPDMTVIGCNIKFAIGIIIYGCHSSALFEAKRYPPRRTRNHVGFNGVVSNDIGAADGWR